MENDILLSIIIVNYNGRHFLADCLESIATHVSCTHEVIVVDNASIDGSVDFIKESFPGIALVENPENSGFAIGNNIGASMAKGKYLLLLNNDTRLMTDVIPAILLLDEQADIGAVGAMMFGRENEYRFSCGYFPSPFRLIRISSLYRKDGPFLDGSFRNDCSLCYPVDWVEGSFLLTRADLWRRMGGLDEGCFMYGEDIDYCKRIRLDGYNSVYCPNVRYMHYVGYGNGRVPLIVKGFVRYHKRHSGMGVQVLVSLILGTKLTAGYVLNMLVFFLARSSSSRERIVASRQALAMLINWK